MGASSRAPTMAPGSARLGLARLALRAASEVPNVLGTDPGPQGLRVVADSPEYLRGVSVTAEGDGRYAVDLCLVAGMVPLQALADQVRERVRRHAQREGLERELGTVNVEFAAIMGEEEAAAAATAAVAEALDALTIARPPVAEPTFEAESATGTDQTGEAERALGPEQRVVTGEQGTEPGAPVHPEEATQPEAWIIEGTLAIKGAPGQSAAGPPQYPRPAEGDSPPPAEAGERRPL